MPDERLTLREAAGVLGISEGGVRKRVKRGKLRSKLGEDGRRYVYLDDKDIGDGHGPDARPDSGTDALIAELRDRVRFVERQLEAERQAHAEARRIVGGLVQRIPELEAGSVEAPSEPRNGREIFAGQSGGNDVNFATPAAERPPERRSWWLRWFGA